MPRFRFNQETGDIVDLDGISATQYFDEVCDPANLGRNDWRKTSNSPPITAPMIMSDIEGYRTVAADSVNGRGRVHIGSRSRHREFLKDNSYIEVGNECFNDPVVRNGGMRKETKAEFKAKQASRIEAIKRSIDLVKTNRVAEHFNVNGHNED